MSQAKIVIGLQFGDEGKGITTDFLCTRTNDSRIVVRFSGGQQAGHNVTIGDLSHVHSNFGSGTLRGVPSYFSEYCTFYPLTMFREMNVLKTKGITPTLYLNPRTMITTPSDVAINRIMEAKNGHGTCGLGVGSTMYRNLKTGYKLFAMDLLMPDLLHEKLKNIRNFYIDTLHSDDRRIFIKTEREEYSLFLHALEEMDYKFNIEPYTFLNKFRDIVFEGSQGILLDMDYGSFPNVTYAHTTSKNALEICEKLRIKEIELYYVTRCYQTRHGAGWMSSEGDISLINNQAEINVFNEWQKKFRVGELDYDLLNYALRIDNIYSEDMRKNLVVTCLDQRPEFNFEHNKLECRIRKVFHSTSPDSKDIKWVNK